MPNIRWLLALITVVHRALYRVTGGRIGQRAGKRATCCCSRRSAGARASGA